MARFKDALNREWKIEILYPDVKELRELGFDLNKAKRDSDVMSTLEDNEIFGRVIGYLCESQIKAAGITEKEFFKGFNGAACWAAIYAIIEAFTNFSLPPGPAQAATKRLPELIQKNEARMIAAIENSASSGSAANSPESSASIPEG